MSEPIEIIDDTENSRFVYREDGVDAQLVYEGDGDRLVLVHTEVPKALGGRGIGGALVRAAVDRAAASGETVAPWCSYTRKWLEDRADEASRIAIDWAPPPQR
ncbi:MAG: N-acetyltransferase [Acidimicrobiia bacterium]|jgi:predicted GNAT family acetyltransferase|nr:N-acetyltransferase [Acidimicrobiia bacterium]